MLADGDFDLGLREGCEGLNEGAEEWPGGDDAVTVTENGVENGDEVGGELWRGSPCCDDSAKQVVVAG